MKLSLTIAITLCLLASAQAQVSPRAHQMKGEARAVRDASRSTTPKPAPSSPPATQPRVDNPSNAPTAPASAIHQSAARGDTEVLRTELTSNPKSVSRKDSEGFTPLHVAASSGQLEAVELLLESGADVNARGLRGETPLLLAAGAGQAQIVEALLKAGADSNIATKEGRTPLHRASMEGSLDSVKARLKAGADPKAQDGQGRTALDLAERYKKGNQATLVISELLKAR